MTDNDIELPDGYTLIQSLDKEPEVMGPDGECTSLAKFMQNEVVEYQEPVSWLDSDPDVLSHALTRRSQNRTAVIEWVWENLVDGVDYGRIHFVKNCPNRKPLTCSDPSHFSKPSLWKAGAEKIIGMLNLRAEWPELVDELRTLRDGGKIIALRCILIDQYGRIVSEGAGARSLDADYGDPNKALKMCKKSSLIDAVLNAAGLSEVFTQDIDETTSPEGQIDDYGQTELRARAEKYWGDTADDVLQSLARRKFKFSDGNWRRIPAYRLQDALRSLDEKHAEESK